MEPPVSQTFMAQGASEWGHWVTLNESSGGRGLPGTLGTILKL